MKYITIPNLDKYQHYKNRNIIWIKLHVDILQDYKFCQLNNEERWFFIGLILLAVKNDNKIPFNLKYIALKVTFFNKFTKKFEEKLMKFLNKTEKMGLISIKMLAKCAKMPQNASPIRIDKIRREEKRGWINSLFKKKKPYFRGQEMRRSNNRWWVLPGDGGAWLEFAGEESEIEWK